MTNAEDFWADLERLASPEAAKKAELARNRSSFRPPFIACTADIVDVEGPYTASLNNGQQVMRVALHLENLREVEYVDGADQMTEATIEIGLPDDIGKAQPNAHAEYFLTVDSLRVHKPDTKSIRDFKGLKNVRLEERGHEFTGNRFVVNANGSQTDRQNRRGDWQESVLTTRYYHVVALSMAGGNGAKAPADIPDALRAAALQYISGLARKDVKPLAIMKDAAILSLGDAGQRSALMTQLMDGSFYEKAIADGLVGEEAGVFVLQGSLV